MKKPEKARTLTPEQLDAAAGGGNAVATTVRGSEVAATITHGIHRYGGNDKDNNAVVVSAG